MLAFATAAIAVASAASAAKVIHAAPRSADTSSALVADVAATKLATARYVNNLGLAKQDGYQIITKMIPTMGYHFMNPAVKGFDVSKPPILVYEHQRVELAARRRRVGVHLEAGEAARPGRDLRHLRGRLPLRRRDLRPGRGAVLVPGEWPRARARSSPSGTRSS